MIIGLTDFPTSTPPGSVALYFDTSFGSLSRRAAIVALNHFVYLAFLRLKLNTFFNFVIGGIGKTTGTANNNTIDNWKVRCLSIQNTFLFTGHNLPAQQKLCFMKIKIKCHRNFIIPVVKKYTAVFL